jgi:hypothetical protein
VANILLGLRTLIALVVAWFQLRVERDTAGGSESAFTVLKGKTTKIYG